MGWSEYKLVVFQALWQQLGCAVFPKDRWRYLVHFVNIRRVRLNGCAAYSLPSGRTQASRSVTGIGRLMYSRAMTKLLAGSVSKRLTGSTYTIAYRGVEACA